MPLAPSHTGAGRCLEAPESGTINDCTLDAMGVRPGGFAHTDYSFWTSQNTAELKMTYKDIGPDSDNVQKAKDLDWVPDAALLQRRLRAASPDDWAAFAFDAPMLPTLSGFSTDTITGMTLPFLQRGTTWVPDWTRPSKTNNNQGPYGSARGASFLMDRPYVDNAGQPQPIEDQLWNRDCFGCSDDDTNKLYQDECGAAQDTTNKDSKTNYFPESSSYSESVASSEYALSCSAMGWGCYDEVYRCNVHNFFKAFTRLEDLTLIRPSVWDTGKFDVDISRWSEDTTNSRTHMLIGKQNKISYLG